MALGPTGKQKQAGGRVWIFMRSHEVWLSGQISSARRGVASTECVDAWEGVHTPPSDAGPRPGLQPRSQTPGPGSQGGRGPSPGIQWNYLRPTAAAETHSASCPCLQHRLSDFQPVTATLTGTSGPAWWRNVPSHFFLGNCRHCNAVIHCICVPSGRPSWLRTHWGTGICSQNCLWKGGKGPKLVRGEENR